MKNLFNVLIAIQLLEGILLKQISKIRVDSIFCCDMKGSSAVGDH